MDVGEIMTQALVTARPQDTVRFALDTLHEQTIRHLPVVEEGRLLGLISDRDLRQYEGPRLEPLPGPDVAAELLDTPLSVVMQGSVVSVDVGDPLTQAIDLMLEHRIGAVPVVERHADELVGIISYVDVLRALRETA